MKGFDKKTDLKSYTLNIVLCESISASAQCVFRNKSGFKRVEWFCHYFVKDLAVPGCVGGKQRSWSLFV